MLQMLGLAAGTLVFVVALYALVWAGRGADFTVSMFQFIFRLDYDTALRIYQTVFRNNAEIILMLAFAAVFCGYLYFFITRFTRYFNEINTGINALVQEGNSEIRLSPEMEPIEYKLNAIRQNLKDRELAAKMAEQRKNELVMYLAHDIRTPLTSVIGYLSLLDEVPDMPMEQKAKYVHITLDKAIRLEKLVNEFFEITRFNSQNIVLQTENIDLCYMLVQLLDEFHPILSSKGNTAVLNADENLTLVGDPVKLARVFSNLLKNASAYSEAGTEILVFAEETGGMVHVSFRNAGCTIPAEKLPALFDKFYRLDESRTSDTGGSGLGLSIAKEIAEAHGGTILAASENDTVTFTVSLPSKG